MKDSVASHRDTHTAAVVNLVVTRDLLERFIAHIDFTDGHWLWTGRTQRSRSSSTRYGRLKVHGRNVLAHRLALEWWHGPIPAGCFALHTCHVSLCVNPSHLYAGTHRQNMADRQMAGRTARGERQGRSKLTETAVREIFTSRERPSLLATRYGVSRPVVTNIRAGRSWTHVTKMAA